MGRLSAARIKAEEQLTRMAEILAEEKSCVRLAANVSGWTPLQHLEHLALAGEVMLSRIEESLLVEDATQRTTGKLHPIAYLVLATGRIPRRKSQAPEFTVPTGCAAPDLLRRINSLNARVSALCGREAELSRNRHRTKHPILGDFTAGQWLRFLVIHQGHHLRIVEEVLASR